MLSVKDRLNAAFNDVASTVDIDAVVHQLSLMKCISSEQLLAIKHLSSNRQKLERLISILELRSDGYYKFCVSLHILKYDAQLEESLNPLSEDVVNELMAKRQSNDSLRFTFAINESAHVHVTTSVHPDMHIKVPVAEFHQEGKQTFKLSQAQMSVLRGQRSAILALMGKRFDLDMIVGRFTRG